jgi:hypothetical protein
MSKENEITEEKTEKEETGEITDNITYKKHEDGSAEITISEERVVRCRKIKGRDTINAQKMMGGDTAKLVPVLAHLCVTVNNEKKTMEFYLDELDVIDYSEVALLVQSFFIRPRKQ